MEPLTTDLERAYRKACTSMGVGFACSLYYNTFVRKHEEIAVPPRAANHPDYVVRGWKKRVRTVQILRAVTSQSLFVGVVASVFYGTELLCARMRHGYHPLNTAVGGALTGALLGVLVPGPGKLRVSALGSIMGATAGYASGALESWTHLLQKASDGESSGPDASSSQGKDI